MTDSRLAVVLAQVEAVPPPGVPAGPFAEACRADTYEVLAGLEGVTSGIAGPDETEELLWPDSVLIPAATVRGVVDWAADWAANSAADRADSQFATVVVVPADVPDLPQLVIAKVFKALIRARVCVAPERGGAGAVAIGVRLPWPPWLPDDLALDIDPYPDLVRRAPDRRRLARGPEWHRLRTPGATDRLDPGLEGWEETRALLAGRPFDRSLPE
jgi:hypothetical protein